MMTYTEYTNAKRTAIPTVRKLLFKKNKLTRLTARAAHISEVMAPKLERAYLLHWIGMTCNLH